MNRHLLDDTVHKINSDDTKPLNTLIGETKSLISSQHSNTNSLINTLKAGNVPVVKSVQRGIIDRKDTSDKNMTVSISPVNSSKSILLWHRTAVTGTGAGYTEDDEPGRLMLDTSGTYLTAECTKARAADKLSFGYEWQVIEFY